MAALAVFVAPMAGMGPGFGWTIVMRGSLEETVDIDGDDPMSATTIAPTAAMRAAITACQGLNRRKKLLLLLVIVVPPTLWPTVKARTCRLFYASAFGDR